MTVRAGRWVPLLIIAAACGSGPAARAEDKKPPPAPAGVPPEYVGAASPLERSETRGAIERARSHFDAGDWNRGFALIDELLAGSPAALQEEHYSTGGIRVLPLARALRDLLASLPEEGRAAYRRTYEAPARERLQEALGSENARALAGLAAVGRRYPLLDAGREAWSLLGARLLDAARAGEAAQAFTEVLSLPPSSEAAGEAAALAQAAAAHHLAGEAEAGDRLLDGAAARFPAAVVQVRGEAVFAADLKSHALFAALRAAGAARRNARAPGPIPSWPTSRGAQDGTRPALEAERLPELGSQAKWVQPPAARDEEAPRSGRRPPAGFFAGAVAHGDLIFLRTAGGGGAGNLSLGPFGIAAIQASTGKLRWSASPPAAGGGAGGPGHVHARQGLAGNMLLTLHEGTAPPAAILTAVTQPSGVSVDQDGNISYEPNALVAYDPANGKLLWRMSNSPADESAGAFAFTAAPVSAGEGLVALGARREHVYAVGVSLTGKLRWRRRLYRLNWNPAQGIAPGAMEGYPLAASGRFVAAADGRGLVAALDGDSGDVLWLSRYRSGIRHGYHPSRWRDPGVAVAGDLVLLAAADSDWLTAFRRDSGEVAWERQLPSGYTSLVGTGAGCLYLAGGKVLALDLENGKDAWEAEPAGLGRCHGFLAADRLLLCGSGGALQLLDARDGKALAKMRLADPRLPEPDESRLIIAGGELVLAGGRGAAAIASQSDSWSLLERERGARVFERARLLSGEGKFAEALAALHGLLPQARTDKLRERLQRSILATARRAAEETENPEFVSAVLRQSRASGAEKLALGRPEELALRLLEAQLLLGAARRRDGAPPPGAPGDRSAAERERMEAAIGKYRELAALGGEVAATGDGTEVAVGAYAADVLRELRLAGETVASSADEEKARERLAGASPPVLADFVLRRPHLQATAGALARLAEQAAQEGALARAAELRALLRLEFPGAAPADGAAEGATEFAAEPATPGLDAVLGAGPPAPLAQRFWMGAEEGVLAAPHPTSEAASMLFALAKDRLRAFDENGRTVYERELPGYPDVSEAKAAMQSHIEEPAIVHLAGDSLIVFTAGGLYGFRAAPGAAPGDPPRGEAPPPSASARSPRLAWARPYPHALERFSKNRSDFGWWGGLPIPERENFFPELALSAGGDPIVLQPDGSLECTRRASGKCLWRFEAEGRQAASPPRLRGDEVLVETTSPRGLAVYSPARLAHRRPGAAAAGADGAVTFTRSSGDHGVDACLAGAGLAAVFSGQDLEAADAATGRLLWRRRVTGRVAFVAGDEVWVMEGDGKLTARSFRSGRERRTVSLKSGGVAVDAVRLAGAAPERLLLVCRQFEAGRATGGSDLLLVRLAENGEKLWEREIHRGRIVPGGPLLRAASGRFVLAFNAEVEPEKWYTRALAIDPEQVPDTGATDAGTGTGTGAAAAGTIVELFRVEIHGKGTAQPPRLGVVAGGLAVGNADGFGWFAPAGAAPAGGGQKDG